MAETDAWGSSVSQTRRNTVLSQKGKMTAVKLQRERTVASRRREKQGRRAGPKKAVVAQVAGEDPDLAGIRLGPQPLQDWQRDE